MLLTVPDINTIAPINYSDLTDDEKQNGVLRTVGFPSDEVSASTEYTLTATPSETWSIVVLDEYGDPTTIGDPGDPVAFGSVTTDSHGTFVTAEMVVLSVEDTSDPSSRNIPLILTVKSIG